MGKVGSGLTGIPERSHDVGADVPQGEGLNLSRDEKAGYEEYNPSGKDSMDADARRRSSLAESNDSYNERNRTKSRSMSLGTGPTAGVSKTQSDQSNSPTSPTEGNKEPSTLTATIKDAWDAVTGKRHTSESEPQQKQTKESTGKRSSDLENEGFSSRQNENNTGIGGKPLTRSGGEYATGVGESHLTHEGPEKPSSAMKGSRSTKSEGETHGYSQRKNQGESANKHLGNLEGRKTKENRSSGSHHDDVDPKTKSSETSHPQMERRYERHTTTNPSQNPQEGIQRYEEENVYAKEVVNMPSLVDPSQPTYGSGDRNRTSTSETTSYVTHGSQGKRNVSVGSAGGHEQMTEPSQMPVEKNEHSYEERIPRSERERFDKLKEEHIENRNKNEPHLQPAKAAASAAYPPKTQQGAT